MLRHTRAFGALTGLATALALLLGTAFGSLAEETAVAPSAEVSQDQIQAFVDAALAVQRIEEEFGGRLQDADTPEEAEQLHQQAQAEAVQAVEDSGLTIPEYFLVLEAANADPELHDTIVAMLQERLE